MPDYPIKHLASNPSLDGFARLIPDLTFTDREEPLQLQLMQPWGLEDDKGPRLYPGVVFVQGSSWTFPDVNFELPQLAQLARRGYVVATVTHRSARDGHRAPAFLEDVKTAVRFLRAHAVEYHIDPERVGIWGTSSGGNAALLAGLTGDDPGYQTDEWAEQSDRVSYVVDCFGPADAEGMFNEIRQSYLKARETAAEDPATAQAHDPVALEETFRAAQAFIGGPDNTIDFELVSRINPIGLIKEGRTYPPFLILHGDQDETVSINQSIKFYHALRDHGTEAGLVVVEGAPHEGSFWSQELLDIVWAFIDQHS